MLTIKLSFLVLTIKTHLSCHCVSEQFKHWLLADLLDWLLPKKNQKMHQQMHWKQGQFFLVTWAANNLLFVSWQLATTAYLPTPKLMAHWAELGFAWLSWAILYNIYCNFVQYILQFCTIYIAIFYNILYSQCSAMYFCRLSQSALSVQSTEWVYVLWSGSVTCLRWLSLARWGGGGLFPGRQRARPGLAA